MTWVNKLQTMGIWKNLEENDDMATFLNLLVLFWPCTYRVFFFPVPNKNKWSISLAIIT